MYEPPKLTGNTRHRNSWQGKWILEVEEEVSVIDTNIKLQPGIDRMRRVLRWRDARLQDYIAMRDFEIRL